MDLESLVNCHRAWDLLNSQNLGDLELTTKRKREIAVSKYAKKGLNTKELCEAGFEIFACLFIFPKFES